MKKDGKLREKLPSANLKRETKSHLSIPRPVRDVLDLVQKRTKLTRQKEERYRSIVETANEGIWEIDK